MRRFAASKLIGFVFTLVPGSERPFLLVQERSPKEGRPCRACTFPRALSGLCPCHPWRGVVTSMSPSSAIRGRAFAPLRWPTGPTVGAHPSRAPIGLGPVQGCDARRAAKGEEARLAGLRPASRGGDGSGASRLDRILQGAPGVGLVKRSGPADLSVEMAPHSRCSQAIHGATVGASPTPGPAVLAGRSRHFLVRRTRK